MAALARVSKAVLVRGGLSTPPPRFLPPVRTRMELLPRQRQILLELATGQRTRDVAISLGISELTVKSHRARAFRRLGVTNLITALRRLGWLRLPDD